MRRLLWIPLALVLMGQALPTRTATDTPTPTLTPMGTPWPSVTPTGEATATAKPLAFPTKLEISPSTATIDVGGQVQLEVKVTYANGRVSPNVADEVDWKTDDESIAEVQGAAGTQIYQRNGPNDMQGSFKNGGPVGEVNGMGPGTTNITATFAQFTATAKITVKGTEMPKAPMLTLPTATPGAKL